MVGIISAPVQYKSSPVFAKILSCATFSMFSEDTVPGSFKGIGKDVCWEDNTVTHDGSR